MNIIIAKVSAVIFAIGVIVWGSFALYEGSWDLTSSQVQHSLEIQRQQANGQAQNIVAGWNFQTTLGQEITADITSVEHDTTNITEAESSGNGSLVESLKGQREADADDACEKATEINGSLPQGVYQTTWIHENCQGGSVSPGSQYYN